MCWPRRPHRTDDEKRHTRSRRLDALPRLDGLGAVGVGVTCVLCDVLAEARECWRRRACSVGSARIVPAAHPPLPDAAAPGRVREDGVGRVAARVRARGVAFGRGRVPHVPHRRAVLAMRALRPHPAPLDVQRRAAPRAREPPRLRGGLELTLALGPPGAEQVRHRALDGPPRVLDRAAGPVRRARERPHQRAATVARRGASDAEDRGEPRNPLRAPAAVPVELQAHEANARRRIRDDSAHTTRGECPKNLGAVAEFNVPALLARKHVVDAHETPS